MKQVNGTNDLLFQQIFCVPGSGHLLKMFLKYIFKIKFKYFKIHTQTLPLNPIYELKKIADIIIETDNKIINIEINKHYYPTLNFRNYLYLNSLCNRFIKLDKKYKTYDFIQLNLNCNLPKYYSTSDYNYKIYDKESHTYFLKNVKFIMISLDKLMEIYYNKGNNEVRKNTPDYAKYLIMLKLSGQKLEEYCKGDELMEAYNKRYKELINEDWNNFFLTEEENEELLLGSLREECYNNGQKAGEKAGRVKGKNESKIKIAKNLVKKGMSFKDIIDVTGISKKNLQKIITTL